MTTVDAQLKAFCEGYTKAIASFGGLPETDDWVVWDGFDINFIGNEYSTQAGDGLHVVVFPAGWKDSLPAPLYSFTVGESK